MVVLEQKTTGGFMQKWEYDIIGFWRREHEIAGEKMQEMGNNGWECYAVTNEVIDNQDFRNWHFKRPKE